MTRVESIKEFIYDITNGIVKITDQQANQILHIAENFEAGKVTLYRFDSNNSTWQKQRIIQIEDYKILMKLNEYANSLNYQFYRYDCQLSTGSFAGTIYTSNNNVFYFVK